MGQFFTSTLKDSLGGVRLHDMQLTEWTCTDTSIHNLELWNAPALEVLDLSQLNGGMHITLVQCPRLRYLRLPEGEGNILHIDASGQLAGQVPLLFIEGPLVYLDGVWPEGKLFADASPETPWQGTHLASGQLLGHSLSFTRNQAELLLLRGAPASGSTVLDLPGYREVRWINAGGLKQLELATDTDLQRLHIEQAGELEQILGNGQLDKVLLTNCPALELVETSARVIKLHSCGGSSLQLSGTVGRLYAQDATCEELQAMQVKHADFELCRTLQKVSLPDGCSVSCTGYIPASLRTTARLHVHEATLQQLVQEFADGVANSRDDLEIILPQMYLREHVPVALGILSRLVTLGADPQWIWQLRVELSARNHGHYRTKNRSKKHLHQQLQPGWLQASRQHWRWHLPSDLKEDAWRQDFAIWLACLEGSTDARLYAKTMARSIGDSSARDRLNQSAQIDTSATINFVHWLKYWKAVGHLKHLAVQELTAATLTHMLDALAVYHDSWRDPGFLSRYREQLPFAMLWHIHGHVCSVNPESPLLELLDEVLPAGLEIKQLILWLNEYLSAHPERARPLILRLAVKTEDYWSARLLPGKTPGLLNQLRMLALTGRFPDTSGYEPGEFDYPMPTHLYGRNHP